VATLALFGTRVRLGAMRAAVFLTLQFHSLSWWNTAMTAGMGTGFGFHIYSPSVEPSVCGWPADGLKIPLCSKALLSCFDQEKRLQIRSLRG
jgi:hypothetical protein